jgi:hypothetical protein
VRVGVLISLALHVLVLWGTRAVHVPSSPFVTPPVQTVPAPEGLVVVDVSVMEVEPETEAEPRPEPREPQPEPRPREIEVVEVAPGEPREAIPGAPGVARPGAPEEPRAGEGLSNAERLTPRFSDPRIWFDPRHPLLFGDRLARFARADSAVRAILRDWLDSLALSDEQMRRALDWTYEKDGKRWGISPEGLHLGDITIPIPFQLMPSGPQRRELEQALRDLEEIQLQNLRDDVERIGEERRRAMQERSAEEARKRRGDTTRVRSPPDRPGGGSPPRARFAPRALPLN